MPQGQSYSLSSTDHNSLSNTSARAHYMQPLLRCNHILLFVRGKSHCTKERLDFDLNSRGDVMNNSVHRDRKTWSSIEGPVCSVLFSINHVGAAQTWDQNMWEKKDWWEEMMEMKRFHLVRSPPLSLPLCLSLNLLPLSEECRGEALLIVCQGCHKDSSLKISIIWKEHTHIHTISFLLLPHKHNPPIFVLMCLCLSLFMLLYLKLAPLFLTQYKHTVFLSLHSRNGGEKGGVMSTPQHNKCVWVCLYTLYVYSPLGTMAQG